MLTRRDALKLGAGLAAAAAVPSTLTPAQAAALLDAPLDPGQSPPRRGMDTTDVYDPISFAEGIDGLDMEALTEHQAPEDMALYKQMRAKMLREFPELLHVPADHPWVTLDETALALWCASWMAGVRAGAAYENLRQALVGPRHVCRGCWGVGSIGPREPNHDPDLGGPEVCPDCAGNGTVATPAPRLTIAPG